MGVTKNLLAIVVVAMALVTAPLHAQEARPPEGSMDERLELARELHDVKHVRDSIQHDIENYAKRLPASEREGFAKYVSLKIDFDALERKSIQYAAEVYTAPELRAMIAYYGSPDGRSAELKGAQYGPKIAKDVRKEIDAAIMAAKLGEAPSKK